MFLVTGSSGFIGRRVVKELASLYKDSTIIALDRTSCGLDEPIPGARVVFIKADLLERGTLDSIPKGIRTVFHLAAFVPSSREAYSCAENMRVNIKGTHNLLCRLSGEKSIKNVVYSSSISVYGCRAEGKISEGLAAKADNLYGESKLCGEHMLKLFADTYGFNAVILRYSSVYGPGQSPGTVLPLFIQKALNGQDISLYERGKRFMDFVYVKDVVRANILAAKYCHSGVFNIGSGIPTKMRDLAGCVNDIFGSSKSRIVFSGGKEISPSIFMDITRAKKALGYRPRFVLRHGLLDYRKEAA